MSSYEKNANAFEEIVGELGIDPDPTYSEADTRVKIIDRILHEALDWPEDPLSIRRETHVHEGYLDYLLQSNSQRLIIEAKRSDNTFSLPQTFRYNKSLTVKNLLQKQVDLRKMYDQVATYARESSIPFCVLTNGTQWLIFPGVRTDSIHIRHSQVIVFNGLESIKANFLNFWGLLSYESVAAGSLAQALLAPSAPIEPSFVFNSEGRVNIPYDRNPLSLPLTDVLPKYFGDLAGDPTHTDLLQECFVLDAPVQDAVADLGGDVDEAPSKTITAQSPVMHFYTLPQVSEKLQALLTSILGGQRDTYFQVLLGRVGIGKTTFISYFFDVHNREIADKHFALRLDFRDVSDSTDLAEFFLDGMWKMLSKHPRFTALTANSTLRKVFRDDIELLTRGPLADLRERDPSDYEGEISRFLGRQMQDRRVFLNKLADFLYRDGFARFVLVFDNVDQLDLSLQEKVLRFAYSKMSEYHAFTILSMWEETYYASKRKARVLSTIRTVPIQIARQSITSVIVKRLAYMIHEIESGEEPLALLDTAFCDKETFCKFVTLVQRSLLVDNKRVRMFLELVALGNIRRALEMFHAFLTAGSLETQKILDLMNRHEEYLVPDHEFVKSVMLGSKRFYSESTSDILNLFAIGDIEHPSHFTRLRILQWLYERRHESTLFGLGFMPLPTLVGYFSKVGVSEKDTMNSLRRLTEGALVENDLRAQKLADQAQALRITPTGRYYLTHLCRMFAYIDLSMQDTPFFDKEVFRRIEELCESLEMGDRFTRCEVFLDYLADQEEEELVTLEKRGHDMTWKKRFVPLMRSGYEGTKEFIISKGYG